MPFSFPRYLALLFIGLGVLTAQSPLDITFRDIIIDPTNANTYWAYSTNMLYRSTDAGVNWRPVPITKGLQPALRDVVIHPKTGSTIYAVTSPQNGALLKSIDNGVTWTPSTGDLSLAKLTNDDLVQVFLHRTSPETVYLRLASTLYKSTDGAKTWKPQATISGNDLDINPNDPRRMYQSISSGSGLQYSADEGVTWTPAGILPTSFLRPGEFVSKLAGGRVVSNPSNPDQVLITVALTIKDGSGSSVGGYFGWMFRSADGGKTLTYVADYNGFGSFDISWNGDKMFFVSAGQGRSSDFGATIQSLTTPVTPLTSTFDPQNSNNVFAFSGSGVAYRSTNAGASWTKVTGFYTPYLLPANPVSLTLESGTGFFSSIPLASVEGKTVSLKLTATKSGQADWFLPQTGTSPVSALSFQASAKATTPGLYEGVVTVTPEGLSPFTVPVSLTVLARINPQMRFAVKKLAGNGTSIDSGDGVAGLQAGINCCSYGLRVDEQKNLYFHSAALIRRLTANGTVSVLGGTGVNGFSGDGGPARSAQFSYINDILAGPQGALIIDGGNSRVRAIDSQGVVTTVYPLPGANSIVSLFSAKLARNAAGDLFGADSVAIYQNFSGTPTQLVKFPSIATTAAFVAGPANTFYVGRNKSLLRVNADKTFTTLSGTGTAGFSGDHGLASAAAINTPASIAIDNQNNVFFLDGARIRVIYPNGVIETVAGDGLLDTPSPDGAMADQVSLGTSFWGLTNDAAGNLYLATSNALFRLDRQAASGPIPQVNAGGAVSLASGTARVSAGAIFSIYGTALAANTAAPTGLPLPTTLGGVQVVVNGRLAPLFYVSPTQINAQIPWETSPGNASVVVTREGTPSMSITVPVTAAAPDILQYGDKRAVAIMPDGSLNGPGNGASAGTFLVVYFTGVGAVDQAVATGSASPSDPLARVKGSAAVTIGGRSAQAPYIGLAPTFVGLGQMNVAIPDGLAPGDYPLILTINGLASNSVLVTVK